MRLLFLITILLLTAVPVAAQTDTTLSYQGQLHDGSGPVTGTPNMEFRLFDSLTDGAQIGDEVILSAVPVTDGLFQVELDFGAAYGAGPRYLEVIVGGSTLAPRQRVAPAPLATHALNVETGAVGGAQIVDGSITAADVADGTFWSTSGDAAGSGDFIGTTNGTPLELRVNNRLVTRIFDGSDVNGIHNPNLIAGSELNVLDESGGSVHGATIAGGGGTRDLVFCGPDGDSPCVNTVANDFATVIGGRGNYATGGAATAMGEFTTASGRRSTAMGNFTFASGFSSTAMGLYSTASGASSTAMGNRTTASGDYSTAMGFASTASGYEATAMGQRTTASGSQSTAMGRTTTASGYASTAIGLDTTAGGGFSLAAGNRAIVRDAAGAGETDADGNCTTSFPDCGDEGTFVWADSQDADFTSTGPNQFLVRAAGGADFQLGSNGLKAFSESGSTSGAAVQAESTHADGIALVGRTKSSDATLVLNNRGSGSLIKAFTVGTRLLELENNGDLFISGFLQENSDRNAKEAIESIDNDHILRQVARLDITSWRYKDNPEHVRHIGPMAQDFHALFGFGKSETSLAGTDVRGVALAAIQALHDKNRTLETRLGGLETELEAQSREVADLKAENARLIDMAQNNRELEQRLATLEALLIDQQLAQKEGP